MKSLRARSRALAAAIVVTGALAAGACLPPTRDSTEPPRDLEISKQRALELGRQAMRARCWASASWRVVWWDERELWAVWCRMEDEESFAECSARVDAHSGEVKVERLCTSTSW